jgi:undecaprenyl-diphosphatase
MLTYFQAVILGLLQGIAEPFPISSLGHSVILPRLLGWHVNQSDPFFLTFLVATHFATAIIFIFIFRKDWANLIKGFFRSIAARKIPAGDIHARLAWLLIVGTVPAGILGLLFQKRLTAVFASPVWAAAFLVLNGVLLYAAEQLRKKTPDAQVLESDTANAGDYRIAEKVTMKKSFAIGTAQALSLIPGLSRSGASMGGGLLVGLSNADAARFSFLLATPVIFAASLLKLPSLFGASDHTLLGIATVGALVAAVASYFSVHFLMRFLRTNRLTPFAIYCFVAGIAALVYFLV